MRFSAIATVLFLVLGAGQVNARTWHITPDGNGDAPTIQAGIDSAQAGDEVLLAAGTYYWINQGAGTPFMLTLANGVRLHSESGADVTTIDVQDQAYGILCYQVDQGTIVEGLTIRRARGAGIYVHSASPLIISNEIIETTGPAIQCLEGASPDILDNVLASNSVGVQCNSGTSFTISGNTIMDNSGPGVSCGASPLLITNNRITDNHSNYGGGIAVGYASPTISNNLISGNTALYGGGISNRFSPSATIQDNLIIGNTATENGGGIECLGSDGLITNNTVVANSALRGGGIYCESSSPSIWRNIIAGSLSGGALYCTGSQSTIVCNDLWNNVGGDGSCSIYNGDNIRLDPMFCDELAGNYYLHTDSPCAPENSPPACGLIGAFPTDCSPPIAVENMTWGRIKAVYR